jgi:hypothetical protein
VKNTDPPSATTLDRRWALKVTLAAVALTLLPYLFGLSLQGANASRSWFSWLGYTLDDDCVYWSWMRQAGDGSFFQQNLFTTDPQSGRQFNLFFVALGTAMRVTGLSAPVMYAIARVACALILLHAAWWLLNILVANRSARKAGFLLICFGAGLGWLPGLWTESGQTGPVDIWQPEAITFLSLYLRPLFTISLALMAGAIGYLYQAEHGGGKKSAFKAGLCGLLLGNVHGYDVITLILVLGMWLVVRAATEKKLSKATLLHAAIAGGLAAISTGYQFYLLKTEQVFAKRVAVETLSPSPMLYILAFGLILVLAVIGAKLALRHETVEEDGEVHDRDTGLLLVCWAVMNLVAAYLPVAFQRKMIMGEHLALCALAGMGVAWLLRALPEKKWPLALAGLLVIVSLTNVRFLLRDMSNLQNGRAQTLLHRPYLYAGEVAALAWLREHTQPGDAIQPLPWIEITSDRKFAFMDISLATMAPGLTGRKVNAGHWGETPNFGEAMMRWASFLKPQTTDAERSELLKSSGVKFVVLGQKRDETTTVETRSLILNGFRRSPPAAIHRVFENEDVDIYEVAVQ